MEIGTRNRNKSDISEVSLSERIAVGKQKRNVYKQIYLNRDYIHAEFSL